MTWKKGLAERMARQTKAEKEKIKFTKIAVLACLGYFMMYGILAALAKLVLGVSLLEELRIVANTAGNELGLTALITLIGGAADTVAAIRQKIVRPVNQITKPLDDDWG